MDGSVDPGRFIGRGSALARLGVAMDAARTGTAQTVIVAGEAGIGKTSLVDHWAAQARSAGWHVVAGACLQPGGGSVPYAPFVEALRTLIRSVEPARWPALLGPGRAELARLLPEIGRSDVPVEVAEVDQGGQGRLFEAVLGVMERLAGTGPLAVVVDDLQWADDGTRDLLGFLIRGLRAAPALFVVTVRTDDLDRRGPVAVMLAELERDDHVARIDLPGMDRGELAELLAPILGDDPPRDRLDPIHERTAGNPFFAEQLAEIDAGGTAESALPPRLRDVLTDRLARSTDATQAVVRIAAAAGRQFDDDLLAAVSGRTSAEIADAVREAIGDGILAPSGDGYAFRHAIVRDVAYDELVRGERVRLHRAFAEELRRRGTEGQGAVASADLAYHWDAAGDAARATAAHIEAGLAAEHVYAFAAAGRHFDRALSTWDDASTDRADPWSIAGLDRIGVMQHAAEAAVLTGAADRAVVIGRAAIAALEGSDDPDPVRLGRLHERLRWYLWESGDQAGAAIAVADAIRLIPVDPPTEDRARALAQGAGLRLLAGDLAGARDLAEAALGIARGLGAPGEEALALGILGWAQAVTGDVDGGVATFREGLTVAERIGGVEGIALGYANLAALLDRVGRTEASLEAAQDGFALVQGLGMARTYGGILLGHAAKALLDEGRLDEAATAADTGLDLDPRGRPAVWLHTNRARIDTNQGRFDDAATHLRRAGEIDDGIGGAELYRPALLAGVAELAMWHGRIQEVRGAVASGLAAMHPDRPVDPAFGWLAWHALRAEADVAVDARSRQDAPALDDVQRHVSPLIERLAQLGGGSPGPVDSRRPAIVRSCRAEIERLEGRRDPATWAMVVAEWTTVGRPLPIAYASYRLAEAILGAHGDRADATAALASAAATATRLSLVPLQGEIDRLARQARLHLSDTDGGDASSAATEDGFGLTDRETEVLRLVAAGWSNQQIADALFITRKTASVHVSNILGKFGVRNRVEAAAVAHRLGLDDAGPPPDGR